MNGLKALYKTNLLTFKGIRYLFEAIRVVGINLMTLLYIRQRLSPDRIAFQEGEQYISYQDLYLRSQFLADQIYYYYQVRQGKKIAVIACNQLDLVSLLFALSVLGADIYLLNAEISTEQLSNLNQKCQFDLIIHDSEIDCCFDHDSLLPQYCDLVSITKGVDYSSLPKKITRKVSYFSKVIVLTSGSTGHFKIAKRTAKTTNFLMPFYQLLVQLKLYKYRSIYIATPIYHGFGVATLCMSVVLGATGFITKKFIAKEACDLIDQHRVEVVTLVPLMLHRMLRQDTDKLHSLKCIITGGAPIAEALVIQTLQKLGKILFNLYGTSEAGVCTIATPEDLVQHPTTIGKKITGLKVKLVPTLRKPQSNIGEFYVKCAWSTQQGAWLSTGDIASVDIDCYYYLQGRVDDMIVSGGENVYPVSLEKALLKHPMIDQVYITSIQDAEFGQRLVAFIVLGQNQSVTNEVIFIWLQTQISRYQMPKKIIVIPEIPITQIGKPDKRVLLQLL